MTVDLTNIEKQLKGQELTETQLLKQKQQQADEEFNVQVEKK